VGVSVRGVFGIRRAERNGAEDCKDRELDTIKWGGGKVSGRPESCLAQAHGWIWMGCAGGHTEWGVATWFLRWMGMGGGVRDLGGQIKGISAEKGRCYS